MLSKLAVYHTDWIKMVKAMGGDDFTDDIVQEMYLKINDKGYNALNDEGNVNKFYVWRTLHSILMTYFKEKGKVIKVPIEEYKHLEENDSLNEHYAYHDLHLSVNEEVKTWHWYDGDLFDLYRTENTSIRKIAALTGISWVSIFNTLKECKLKIKENLKEDYETYKKETS